MKSPLIAPENEFSEALLRRVLIAHWRWSQPMVNDLVRMLRRQQSLDAKRP